MIISGRITPFIILLTWWIAELYFIRKGMKGEINYIRRIPALDGITEAIGKAAEEGKSVHYSAGDSGSLRNSSAAPMILAAMSLLTYVSEHCARMGAKLIVTSAQADALPLTIESVRDGYRKAGADDEYVDDTVRFVSEDQIAYSAGAIDMFVTENVGASFLFGYWAGMALVLLGAAQDVNAMQVGGTPRGQNVYMVVVADYSLIYEEMYAAAAYVSQDAMSINSIAGQDWHKIILIAIIVASFGLALLGLPVMTWLGM